MKRPNLANLLNRTPTMDMLLSPMRTIIRSLSPPHRGQYAVVPVPPPKGRIALGGTEAIHRQALEMLVRLDRLKLNVAATNVTRWLCAHREAVATSVLSCVGSVAQAASIDFDANENHEPPVAYARKYAGVLDHLITLAAEQGHRVLTFEWICDAHRALMQLDPKSHDLGGKLRNTEVLAGLPSLSDGCLYNPPLPGDLARCLNDAVDYMRCEGEQGLTQSVIIRIAITQAHLQAVLPFNIGNGRLMRLLSTVIMAADGHTPLHFSSFLDTCYTQYKLALRIAQAGDLRALVSLISQGIIAAGEEALNAKARLDELVDNWLTRASFRAGSAARRVIDVLPLCPLVTGKSVAARLSLSPVPARHAIAQLVDAGILFELTGYSRNRIFVAHEVEALAAAVCGNTLPRPSIEVPDV